MSEFIVTWLSDGTDKVRRDGIPDQQSAST
jgi:hypothetical protein